MTIQLDVNPAASPDATAAAPTPARVVRAEHAESSFTRVIEQQTGKIPSHVFLMAGLGSMAASFALELADRPRASRFVGMWAPTLLIMGVYNKLVKLGGVR